jgi:hypothetical protein
MVLCVWKPWDVCAVCVTDSRNKLVDNIHSFPRVTSINIYIMWKK